MSDERRDAGRDGVSGLLSRARRIRAREVSRPDADDARAAEQALPALLARAKGRRQ